MSPKHVEFPLTHPTHTQEMQPIEEQECQMSGNKSPSAYRRRNQGRAAWTLPYNLENTESLEAVHRQQGRLEVSLGSHLNAAIFFLGREKRLLPLLSPRGRMGQSFFGETQGTSEELGCSSVGRVHCSVAFSSRQENDHHRGVESTHGSLDNGQRRTVENRQAVIIELSILLRRQR